MNRYFVIVRRFEEKDLNDPMVDVFELDNQSYLVRCIRIYKSGERTCATFEAGYKGEFFESHKFFDKGFSEEAQKQDSAFLMFETTKDDFEREWSKISVEENFKLKPFSEYTQEEYRK